MKDIAVLQRRSGDTNNDMGQENVSKRPSQSKQPSRIFSTAGMVTLSAALVAAVAIYSSLYGHPVKAQDSSVEQELGPLLSPSASIILPNLATFTNASKRWSVYDAPRINAVISVATESDVEQTIHYANAQNLSFLAYSGGHGQNSALGKVQNGIQIWMTQMNKITIAADRKTATFGGGVMVRDVTKALAAAGKRTVTGVCECVGSVAPMLGGGHGLLQGQYGLIADQLVSARFVLGNGTTVTVSNTSHTDLFWSLRGAGHNFGIVTEYTMRIYDARRNETWGLEQFVFAGNQVEALYRTVDQMKKSQPAQVVEWGLFIKMPAVDPINAIVIYTILYDGPLSAAKKYAAPIQALSPITTMSQNATYLELPGLTGNGDKDAACQKGASTLRFPIYLDTYNVTAMNQVYDAFNQMMIDQPALNGSLLLVEGYPTQGVQRVPANATAFPHRSAHMLVSPALIYLPNPDLDATAVKYGQQMRELLRAGTKSAELRAYVNYAHGDESVGSVYGFESWRQQKLKDLKKMYDPMGNFSFYEPIS